MYIYILPRLEYFPCGLDSICTLNAISRSPRPRKGTAGTGCSARSQWRMGLTLPLDIDEMEPYHILYHICNCLRVDVDITPFLDSVFGVCM